MLDGLAALDGADLAEDEIRLLAAGARVAAGLAALPEVARPGDLAELWPAAAATFACRAQAIVAADAGRQPAVAAFGRLAAAEEARRLGTGDRAVWRAVAARGRRPASRTGRHTRGCAKPRRRPGPGGATRPYGRWRPARTLAGGLPSAPLLRLAGELARRARLTVPAGPRPAQPGAVRPGSTSRRGRRRCWGCSRTATATGR